MTLELTGKKFECVLLPIGKGRQRPHWLGTGSARGSSQAGPTRRNSNATYRRTKRDHMLWKDQWFYGTAGFRLGEHTATNFISKKCQSR